MTTKMRHLAPVAAAMALAVPALAQAAAKPTVSAPSQARVGQTIHVVAHGLSHARNAVTLALDHTASSRITCVARLGIAPAASTTLDLRVKIPSKVTCYTNAVVRGGTIAVRPGAYHLVVAKPTGPAMFSGDKFVRRAIKLVK